MAVPERSQRACTRQDHKKGVLMWIVVPKSIFYRCAVESQDSTSELTLQQAVAAAQYVSLSGKLSPQRSWLLAWKTKPWLRRLSGLTLEHSTAGRGVESWIASLRDIRANHSAPLASELVRQILDIYGPTSVASLAKQNPDSSFSKMSQATSLWDSTQSPAIYKNWATKLRLACLQRRKSAHRTDGSGCLFSGWPTTRVSMANGKWVAKNGKDYGHLETTAENWPTPRAQEPNRTTEGFSRGLKELVEGHPQTPKKKSENWPTPNATDHFRSAKVGQKRGQLSEATEQKWESSHLNQQSASDGLKSSASDQISRPRLNPAFCEWLMGWPHGWTDFVPLATEWSAYVQRMHSYLCLVASRGAER
jgi:hypothetical protein